MVRELFWEDRGTTKGMSLRIEGESIQSYGVEVHKVPRAEHTSDTLTHPVGNPT